VTAVAPVIESVFVAVTLIIYAVPLTRPVSVMGLEAPVWETGAPLPGVAVTVYETTGLLPACAGGENETVNCPSPDWTETFCGADGGANVDATIDACAPGPAALTAVTAKVYVAPAVNPVASKGLTAFA